MIAQNSVSTGQRARRRPRCRRATHTHVPEYPLNFYETPTQFSNVVVEMIWMIVSTCSIIARISVYRGQRARSGPRRRRTMHPHVPEYPPEFYEASKQFSNAVVEIIWMILSTCSIIARISISTGSSKGQGLVVGLGANGLCIPTCQSTQLNFPKPPHNVLRLFQWLKAIAV